MESHVPTLDKIRSLMKSEINDWNFSDREIHPEFASADLQVRLPANNVLRGLSKSEISAALRESSDHAEEFLHCQAKEKFVRQVILSSVRIFAGH